MAVIDTKADVAVANGVWVDLYAGSGIVAGTAVTVYNKGSSACVVAVKSTAPSTTTVGIPLYVGPVGSSITYAAGASGLWAYCPQGTTQLLVQS